ncbi:hypothetical protein P700755_000327 [Psychroflexus torquis ATCC 700755]|uniref:Uncharacterized protein n=1 Tax=Psychroflexus torquis (strain ATCC 700755 / CIP 106069 / ACAM 623) TaxID=313595 RepID=K4IBR6_PSYTT|nr:hypothetical protein [Psychroflexus torquis]AFU67363.1 hypothetical protein P700755_000327 [Psychroflexus torquis ATCC 700755]
MIGAVSGAVVGGAIGGFTTPKSHNIWTGNRIRPAIESISELKSIGKLNPYDKGKEGLKLSQTKLIKNQYRSNVFDSDYNEALKKWNNIKNQYKIDQPSSFPDGFSKQMPDGSTINSQFYYGGKENPTGWNIKIITTFPKPPIVEIPAEHIRFFHP